MTIIDRLTSLIAPYECLGCGREGSLLCFACQGLFLRPPSCCYRCRRPVQGSRICPDCDKFSYLTYVQAAVQYQTVARALVQKYKFGSAPAAVNLLATIMATNCQPLPAQVLIVPAPTSTGRARARGYDQAILLARAIARQQNHDFRKVLARTGQAHQVGANRDLRWKQMQTAFVVAKPKAVQNRHIVLVDDVLTTGATLEAAARTLRQAGASRVDALVFAQA